MDATPEPMLTIQQVAERLAVPPRTIRDWVYRRRIPFVKVGTHVRFERTELDRWLEARRQSA